HERRRLGDPLLVPRGAVHQIDGHQLLQGQLGQILGQRLGRGGAGRQQGDDQRPGPSRPEPARAPSTSLFPPVLPHRLSAAGRAPRTRVASCSSLELILRPARSAASVLTSKRTRLSWTMKFTMPPPRVNASVSPTVSTADPWIAR